MESETVQTMVKWGLLVAIIVAAIGLVGFRQLAGARWGRIALLVAVALLPLSASVAALRAGITESSRTAFCLGCHEMQDHGRSLFVDDRHAIAAVHFQNRLIDRDKACYSCHADYAMFGDVRAKLNGLRHVYVHYFGKVPEKFQLYQPYPNGNCLHCHEDARRFLESPPHAPVMQQLVRNETSCLSCHRTTHELAKARAGQVWAP